LLHRVLLSSLQGAAITSIRIENVRHEFSRLAGVRVPRPFDKLRARDGRVTDIVRMQGAGPRRLQLSATGPADVKAGDIAVCRGGGEPARQEGKRPASVGLFCYLSAIVCPAR